MNTITITVPTTINVEAVAQSRATFVESLGTTYGAARTYAANLVAYFRSEGFGTEWITMTHDAKGAAGDSMRAERDTLYAALKSAGHSNPSVKWKQIKGYAAELIKAEETEDGEAEGKDGEAEGSDKAKHTRSIQLRLIEDLSTLFKACKRESKTLTEQQRKAFTFISSALDGLGIDVSTL